MVENPNHADTNTPPVHHTRHVLPGTIEAGPGQQQQGGGVLPAADEPLDGALLRGAGRRGRRVGLRPGRAERGAEGGGGGGDRGGDGAGPQGGGRAGEAAEAGEARDGLPAPPGDAIDTGRRCGFSATMAVGAVNDGEMVLDSEKTEKRCEEIAEKSNGLGQSRLFWANP